MQQPSNMEGYTLKHMLRSPFPAKILPYLLLIFALLGFLDAAYLTIQHYQHVIPPCTTGGCETVLTSAYATVAGTPIALIGAGFYGLVAVLTGLYLQTRNKQIALSLLVLSTGGLLVAFILVYLQAAILHAFCYYCLFSELIDFLLFDAAWWLWNSKNTELTAEE